MKLNYVYTRLNVENHAACKLFYQDVLGLKLPVFAIQMAISSNSNNS